MATPKLFPFDTVQPSQILSEYSEWIYFTLVLVFFISVSGITLRKHFSKPYVKPLIISVGLMLTVGVFKMKTWLASIFEGWGILGSILLTVMAATIPYGLCRGFGMRAGKAFYLTFVLFYILSWVKFPAVYHGLADHNLGFVNLALLILFLVAVYKTVKWEKLTTKDMASGMSSGTDSVLQPEIDHEIGTQGDEQKLVKKSAMKTTKVEIKTIDHIAEALTQIQRIVEEHRNTLPREERERIASILQDITKNEDIFLRGVHHLQNVFRRIGMLDEQQLKDLRQRAAKVSGKEEKVLKAEVAREEEKLRLEKIGLELHTKLRHLLDSFNGFIKSAFEHMKRAAYPYDAKPYLDKAKLVLKDITGILEEMRAFEEKLVRLTNSERNLLKKEKEAA